MRFNLIDRVLLREPDRLVAVKCVTQAEEYLADHFPGFPVLPGVMMLETLVQAGRLLLEEPLAPNLTTLEASGESSDTTVEGSVGTAVEDDSNPGRCAGPLILAEARNMRYGNMVRPGQTLTVEVTLRRGDDDGYELAGVGRVDQQVAVQGRFRLVPAMQLS